MNSTSETSEKPIPKLILFVTGNAPRSRRARRNLDSALQSCGLESIEPLEIDLLQSPEHTVTYSVFATPALLRNDGQSLEVLYGDLSNERKLSDFLDSLQVD